MNLIVISPEAEDEREHAALRRFFAAGLQSYHLRKPAWSCERMAAWLRALPGEFHSRIFLHSHHELAGDFGVGGLHFRSSDGPQSHLLRSRSVHDLATLQKAVGAYDRVFFSPVFGSISKPGYEPDPKISHGDLKAILAQPRRAEVIALGGVGRSQVSVCHELGFDGVGTLGAVWQAADPVKAFNELREALLADVA